MPVTKQYAKILANMLPLDERRAMIRLSGKNPQSSVEITEDIIANLKELDLVQRDRARNLVLSPFGKKVAEFV